MLDKLKPNEKYFYQNNVYRVLGDGKIIGGLGFSTDNQGVIAYQAVSTGDVFVRDKREFVKMFRKIS